MKSAVRIDRKRLRWFILLISWPVLFAQDQIPIQNIPQSEKEEMIASVPSAVQVVTPKEAEQANTDAVALDEEMHEAETKRSREISQAIAQRNNHHFYKKKHCFL